jgi:hypothetical protein
MIDASTWLLANVPMGGVAVVLGLMTKNLKDWTILMVSGRTPSRRPIDSGRRLGRDRRNDGYGATDERRAVYVAPWQEAIRELHSLLSLPLVLW